MGSGPRLLGALIPSAYRSLLSPDPLPNPLQGRGSQWWLRQTLSLPACRELTGHGKGDRPVTVKGSVVIRLGWRHTRGSATLEGAREPAWGL